MTARIDIVFSILLTLALGLAAPAIAQDPRAQPWLLTTYGDVRVPAAVAPRSELAQVKTQAANRSPEDLARLRWWATGGPVYRWNEIAVGEMIDSFVTVPMALRNLALVHAAMDDAVAVAWHQRAASKRPQPVSLDRTIRVGLTVSPGPAFPSDFAAAATAASTVLGYLLPDRAQAISAKAEDAVALRLKSGLDYPSDVAAGRAIGNAVAAAAIARAKADRSDTKFTGTIPSGPGKWIGTNPIGATAVIWQPWVLARADEFRPTAPPAIESEAGKAALAEVKAYQRTPKSNHRATYWEVFGGARIFALWNETARLKQLEQGSRNPVVSARMLAALNIAMADSAIACFDAKYAYWYIRPSQQDPDVKPVFPPPSHPSYPAAHGCLSTAATTILAKAFPQDSETLTAQGREAADARLWGGIHYRFDIDAGQALGQAVGEKVSARAFSAEPTRPSPAARQTGHFPCRRLLSTSTHHPSASARRVRCRCGGPEWLSRARARPWLALS